MHCHVDLLQDDKIVLYGGDLLFAEGQFLLCRLPMYLLAQPVAHDFVEAIHWGATV